MKNILTGVIAAVLLGAVAAAAFIWSGLYNIAADHPHYQLTHSALETLRVRSIAARADGIEVPNLQNPERIRRGAGNYDSMCVICHLAPGVQPTELHEGLYPQPPNLAQASNIWPARAFWVIKHGIKASGMPAWGKSMEDPYIWDMVAFLTKMPAMTSEQYAAEVAASEGHSHGGGETAPRGHSAAHGKAPNDSHATAGHQHPAGQAHAPDAADKAAEQANVHDKPHAHDKPGRTAAKDHSHPRGTKPHAH